MLNHEQLAELAWLGLNNEEIEECGPGPLASGLFYGDELTPTRLLETLCDPDYFPFICKHIFNVEIPPLQHVILRELWTHAFPMLIASRGGGKSFILALYVMMRALLLPGRRIVVAGSAFRQSKFVFEYCEQIWYNAPILRDICKNDKISGPRRDVDRCEFTIGQSKIVFIPIGDGCLIDNTLVTTNSQFDYISLDNKSKKHDIKIWGNNQFRKSDEFYYNGLSKTNKVCTERGYSIEGTLNHKVKILRNNKIVWCRFDELVLNDYLLLDRSNRWHNGNESITKEQSYALGLILGDGCLVQGDRLGFATQTKEFVESLNIGTGYSWKPAADGQHYNVYGLAEKSDYLNFWEMGPQYALNKVLPPKILRGSQECMSACLRGLFDTDGGVQVSHAKGGTSISVRFWNTSEKLVDQMQYILLHYGIICTKSSRQRENENWNREFLLNISGKDVKIFAEKIGFSHSDKKKLLEYGLSKKKKWFGCDDIIPGLKDFLVEYFTTHDSKGWKGLLNAKEITFERAAKILNKYPELVPIIGEVCNQNIYYDKVVSIEDGEAETYDIHVPDGHEYCANGFFSHNTKIRGLRAHDVISDEFASITEEVFEIVIAGFGVVSSSPIANVKLSAKRKYLIEKGIWKDEQEESFKSRLGNQIVVSGTAFYRFNHFFKYWDRYCKIIRSGGDRNKLNEIMGEGVNAALNHGDFTVIRYPCELLPEGFIDARFIARQRATIDKSRYLMEFGAIFPEDSNGFFSRRLIESCVANSENNISFHSGAAYYEADLVGNMNRQYVYGIDPASEIDNFSIVVLEVWPEHSRVVHCWTTTRKRFKEKLTQGFTTETDFYAYCCRKVRDLMKVFPTSNIVIDSEGGGRAIEESLHDRNRIQAGELPLWAVIDPNKEKPTDGNAGLHILHMINFSDAEWVSNANHGLRKDLEDRILLFPANSPARFGIAAEIDGELEKKKIADTLEDCMIEIEELKDELASIVHTQTGISMRDRWDTPEIKLAGNKKGRQRKDRYSALLMANMIARTIKRAPAKVYSDFIGGFAKDIVGNDINDVRMYRTAPDWFAQWAETEYR